MGRWAFFESSTRMSHPWEEKIQITRCFHLLPTGQTNKHQQQTDVLRSQTHTNTTRPPGKTAPDGDLFPYSNSQPCFVILSRPTVVTCSLPGFIFSYFISGFILFYFTFSLCSRFRWKWGQDRRKRCNFYFLFLKQNNKIKTQRACPPESILFLHRLTFTSPWKVGEEREGDFEKGEISLKAKEEERVECFSMVQIPPSLTFGVPRTVKPRLISVRCHQNSSLWVILL